jgi:hypothetical protein
LTHRLPLHADTDFAMLVAREVVHTFSGQASDQTRHLNKAPGRKD